MMMEEEKERVMHDVSAGECVSLQNCQLGEIKLKLVPKQHAAEITALACLQPVLHLWNLSPTEHSAPPLLWSRTMSLRDYTEMGIWFYNPPLTMDGLSRPHSLFPLSISCVRPPAFRLVHSSPDRQELRMK